MPSSLIDIFLLKDSSLNCVFDALQKIRRPKIRIQKTSQLGLLREMIDYARFKKKVLFNLFDLR